MWPFGERFPYSDTHELNLDWILKTIKEVATKFPELEIAINNKLNKAINPGSAGDILVNNGGGIYEWKNYADEYSDIIIEAVNEWLDEHPEATTTVLDGSITLAKFTDSVKYLVNRKQSPVIAPVYIGDYLEENNMLPSSVYFNGSEFITVDAKTRDYATSEGNGLGKIKIWSLTQNAKVNEFSALVGHGNSITYDGIYYYIAPIWQYDTNGEHAANVIYKYNSEFVLVQEIATPSNCIAVSFDEITNSLYAFSGGTIYRLENNAFVPYSVIADFSSIPENIIIDRAYNQDLAIYNNEFFISSPYGNVMHGQLAPGTSFISDYFVLSHYDTYDNYYWGELEGWEFKNGHLYALAYTGIPGNLNDAFVFEIPINLKAQTSPVMGGLFVKTHATLTLSEETQEKFSIEPFEIRSIEQIFTRNQTNNMSSQITIPADNEVFENRDIMLPLGNYTLNLIGTYKCKSMIARSGMFTIYTAAANNKIIFLTNGSCITVQRSGLINIAGGYSLNVEAENIQEAANNFIYMVNTTLTLIKTALTCNKALFIGSTRISHAEVYHGATPLRYMPDGFILNGFNGLISRSSKEIRIYAHLAKPVSGNYAASGTVILRGINGYVDNASNGINLSNVNATVSIINDYTVCITITKQDDSEFDNTTNNTPIQAEGNITLTKSYT